MTNRLHGVAAAGACALALVLSGCGGSGPAPAADRSGNGMADMPGMDGHDMSQMGAMPGMGGMDMGGDPGAVELWAVQSGPLGVVVTDGGGRIVYRSDKDTNQPPASTCVDACAQSWQPMLMNDKPVSGLGVDETKIGAIARPDGSNQITLYGWPLYTHAGETGGLANTGANGADGAWFAINPTGEKADPLPAAG